MSVRVMCGDCIEVLAGMEAESFSAIVTDPPYHLTNVAYDFRKTGAGNDRQARQIRSKGFMNQAWDGGDVAFRPETWAAVLRVLKPGAYCCAFASSRDFDLTAAAMRAAGFVMHPFIGWITAQGFPKATNFTDPFDEQLLGFCQDDDPKDWEMSRSHWATHWEGWRYGLQALKPAIEPILVGQKPFAEPTGRENVLRHGTGALNIEAGRVPADAPVQRAAGSLGFGADREDGYALGTGREYASNGRWPPNLCHDGSPEVMEAFARFGSTDAPNGRPNCAGKDYADNNAVLGAGLGRYSGGHGDTGTSARFFKSCPFGPDDMTTPVAHDGFACDNGDLFGEPSCPVTASSADVNSPRDIPMSSAGSDAFVTESAGENRLESRKASGAHREHSTNATVDGIDNGVKKVVGEPLNSSNPDGCGNASTDQSQTDLTYITRTTTDPIIGSTISNCDQDQSITPSIREFEPPSSWTTQASDDDANVAKNGSRSANSIHAEEALTAGTASHAAPHISGNGALGSTTTRFWFSGKAPPHERVGSHPTQKPLSLMIWLCQLICPPGGTILDPFAGTGTTLAAADRLGIDAVGIEQDAQTCRDAEAKIKRLRARRMLGDVPKAELIPGQLGLF